jgi:hypothetical protein
MIGGLLPYRLFRDEWPGCAYRLEAAAEEYAVERLEMLTCSSVKRIGNVLVDDVEGREM